MEFYEVVEKRRTVRQFLQKEVDFEAVKRILEAGNRAPTWDHNRSWQYILLRTDEEKEYAFAEAKKIAEKFDAERYLHMPRAYPITLGQKMYGYAMPRQFSMLKSAPYVVIPVCRAKQLQGEGVSHFNPFATIWCVIVNILLAAAAPIGGRWTQRCAPLQGGKGWNTPSTTTLSAAPSMPRPSSSIIFIMKRSKNAEARLKRKGRGNEPRQAIIRGIRLFQPRGARLIEPHAFYNLSCVSLINQIL